MQVVNRLSNEILCDQVFLNKNKIIYSHSKGFFEKADILSHSIVTVLDNHDLLSVGSGSVTLHKCEQGI